MRSTTPATSLRCVSGRSGKARRLGGATATGVYPSALVGGSFSSVSDALLLAVGLALA